MQVVSITSLKGGVGKTTVTLGLASAALSAGLRTLVIDLDPHADATTALAVGGNRKLDVGRVLRHNRRQSIADNVVPSGWMDQRSISPSQANLSRGARSASRADERGRLDVLPGSAYSSIFDRPDLGRRDLGRLKRLLGAHEGHDLVLVDCPPSLNGLTRITWSASSQVLMVAEPALFSVAGTDRTLRALELFRKEYAPNLTAAGIVANRVRRELPEQTYRLSEMKRMFGSMLLNPVLDDRPLVQQIQGAAHAVHRWNGNGAAAIAADFDQLLTAIAENGFRRNRALR